MNGLPSVVVRTFDLMGIAEDEIAAHKREHPRASKRLHAAFKLLCPTAGMTSVAECVYRSHVRELLRRVVEGDDTRHGTDAEAMLALSRASLRAPLCSGATLAYERLFEKVMGRPAPRETGGSPGDWVAQDRYPGESDEFIRAARREVYAADRC